MERLSLLVRLALTRREGALKVRRCLKDLAEVRSPTPQYGTRTQGSPCTEGVHGNGGSDGDDDGGGGQGGNGTSEGYEDGRDTL